MTPSQVESPPLNLNHPLSIWITPSQVESPPLKLNHPLTVILQSFRRFCAVYGQLVMVQPRFLWMGRIPCGLSFCAHRLQSCGYTQKTQWNRIDLNHLITEQPPSPHPPSRLCYSCACPRNPAALLAAFLYAVLDGFVIGHCSVWLSCRAWNNSQTSGLWKIVINQRNITPSVRKSIRVVIMKGVPLHLPSNEICDDCEPKSGAHTLCFWSLPFLLWDMRKQSTSLRFPLRLCSHFNKLPCNLGMRGNNSLFVRHSMISTFKASLLMLRCRWKRTVYQWTEPFYEWVNSI